MRLQITYPRARKLALLLIAAQAFVGFTATAAAPVLDAKAADALLEKYYCSGCHELEKKGVGPNFKEIAKKYAGNAKAPALLAEKVRKGGAGNWGAVPMPANTQITDDELNALMRWTLALK